MICRFSFRSITLQSRRKLSSYAIKDITELTKFCKKYGFAYQSGNLYGGLGGVYDYGPHEKSLWNNFVNKYPNIYPFDSSIITANQVLSTSGHLTKFIDPIYTCSKCKFKWKKEDGNDLKNQICPKCKNDKNNTEATFNLLFPIASGVLQDKSNTSDFLRPETCQEIFTNFANYSSGIGYSLPFGIAQTGKSFRNEINPSSFLFRLREFNQFELEYFCSDKDTCQNFEYWLNESNQYLQSIGIPKEKLRFYEHSTDDLAHYSIRTVDIEYKFPFGWKEIMGVSNRGNFDLIQHSKVSKRKLQCNESNNTELITPNVIETSIGIERIMMSIMFENIIITENKRTIFNINNKLSPYLFCILPIVKSPKLIEISQKIFNSISQYASCTLIINGSVGRRYKKQDIIGTAYGITIDSETEEKNTITVRDRNTTKQIRIDINELVDKVKHNYFYEYIEKVF